MIHFMNYNLATINFYLNPSKTLLNTLMVLYNGIPSDSTGAWAGIFKNSFLFFWRKHKRVNLRKKVNSTKKFKSFSALVRHSALKRLWNQKISTLKAIFWGRRKVKSFLRQEPILKTRGGQTSFAHGPNLV